MQALLSELRKKVAIGYVGGSDFPKQEEQLGTAATPVTDKFDFCFAENGLTAYKQGVQLPSTSFIKWLGEDKYKGLVKFILHYIADLDIPIKRGTFIEFRNGMINVSPIGRNASIQERNEYQKYDLEHKIRETFVGILQEKFADLGLTYASPLLTNIHLLPSPPHPPRSGTNLIAMKQVFNRRPNFLRHLPRRVEQNLLPPPSRSRGQAARRRQLHERAFLRRQDGEGWK